MTINVNWAWLRYDDHTDNPNRVSIVLLNNIKLFFF
jgi:hypothetical protein